MRNRARVCHTPLAKAKHVLSEEPFTDQTEEEASVADDAWHSGEGVMQTFHRRYHARPLKKPAPHAR